jgi:hypothetical protein
VGPVLTKADVQASLDTVTKIREQLVKMMKQGMGPREIIAAAPLQDLKLAGDPAQFIFTAYRGLWGHVRELGGIV